MMEREYATKPDSITQYEREAIARRLAYVPPTTTTRPTTTPTITTKTYTPLDKAIIEATTPQIIKDIAEPAPKPTASPIPIPLPVGVDTGPFAGITKEPSQEPIIIPPSLISDIEKDITVSKSGVISGDGFTIKPTTLPDEYHVTLGDRTFYTGKENISRHILSYVMQQDYTGSGVPDWFSKQVDLTKDTFQTGQSRYVYEHLSDKERKALEDTYEITAYEGFIGLDKPETTRFGALYTTLSGQLKPEYQIEMTKKFGKFGKEGDKTWSEIKKEHPAVYLTIDKGTVTPIFDFKRWQKERHESMGWSGKVSGLLSNIAAGFGSFDYIHKSLTEPTMQPSEIDISKDFIYPSGERGKLSAQWEYTASQAWKENDKLKMGLHLISTPIVTFPIAYMGGKLLGTSIGAFKKTALGSKPILVSRGVWGIGTKAGQPLYTITPAKVLEGGIAGVFGYQTASGLYGSYQQGGTEQLGKDIGQMALTLPFAIKGYKEGHRTGMGWVEKRAAMSKVEDPLMRIRQKGFYETLNEVYKIREPYSFQTKPYDIVTGTKRISSDSALQFSKYLTLEQNRILFSSRPRIGGSLSSKIRAGEFFRTDTMPKSLQTYAMNRQYYSWLKNWQQGSSPKPLIGKELPGDIDILFRDILGGYKRGMTIQKSHVFDVHPYKVGQYYGFGKQQLSSVTGRISNIPKDIKLLSLREQFMRKTISNLPSETQYTGYRSYKDISDWFDIGDILKMSKGSKKFSLGMEKVIHPERFPVPKVTLGERFFGKIKMVEPERGYTPFGEYYQTYPSYVTTPSYLTASSIGTSYRMAFPDSYAIPTIKINYPQLSSGKKYSGQLQKQLSVSPLKYTPPQIKGYTKFLPEKTKYLNEKITPRTIIEKSYGTIPEKTSPNSFYPSMPHEQPYDPYISEMPYKPHVAKTPKMTYKQLGGPYVPEVPYEPVPYVPEPSKPIFPLKIDFTGKKQAPSSGKGFDVMVKDRYIIKGKKRRKEQYKKMNIHPLSESDALSMGATITDNSAARSFIIKPTKGLPKDPSIKVTKWKNIKHQFYTRKNNRKQKVYTEKTDYGINTLGEIEGISAKGWVAQRRRLSRIFKMPKTKNVGYTDMRDAINKQNRKMKSILERGIA